MTETLTNKPPPGCDCRKTGRQGCCRGGHRHGKHTAPARGPDYVRSLELPQVGYRHRNWRWNCRNALRAALEAGDLSREAHATMDALLDHSDGRGKDCWPGQEKLGYELGGLAERTVCGHIAELKAKGWVAVKHRHRITADGIKGRSNIYRPLMPTDAALAGAPPPGSTRAASDGGERRRARPAPSPELEEAAPAVELVARWVAALDAMTADETNRLAAKHLPAIVANRPGHIRTQSLASRLAAEGPP